jgi:hypothetical protein
LRQGFGSHRVPKSSVVAIVTPVDLYGRPSSVVFIEERRRTSNEVVISSMRVPVGALVGTFVILNSWARW